MTRRRLSFPIVGVGASAGGLEAFSQLLGAIPPQLGMAFVLIQHLDPTHPSRLVEALARTTEMPVQEIVDGMVVRPGNVYVIPPNTEVSVLGGAFAVSPRAQRPGKPHMPIDVFFRGLAAERRSQAIGIVLSGTASDGTEGLRAIKAEGGVALVQDPGTAKFSGMPESALTAGVVDLSLPIPDLASELIRLARHPYLSAPVAEPPPQPGTNADLQKVLITLRDAVGVDFSDYKEATIRRRLARRMAVRKAETLKDYTAFLQGSTEEAQALFDDILIHVTSFFRDAEVFGALKARVFPEILKHKQARAPIRMWVPGCSTGEEVYSLVISLFEFLEGTRSKRPIQIFGTDLSETAIGRVRTGVYPDSAVSNLSPKQLQRFFARVEDGYRITKDIRDVCIFVRHDLARDPPFAKLDLISCRNLLIYFNPVLQQRTLETFHYCLNTPGFLLLGHSESVPGRQELFSAADKANKIFARTAVPRTVRPSGPRLVPTTGGAAAGRRAPADAGVPPLELSRQVDHLLLAQYAPPGVIITERLQVVEFRGRTAAYLEPPPGQPQGNLLKMAREGLLSELRVALGHAKKGMTTVRREGVRFDVDGATRICNIVVEPIAGAPEPSERLFAVLFEHVPPGPPVDEPEPRGAGGKRRGTEDALEHELRSTKEYLQSVIGEHQQASDALASTNEELVSSNEELQSMNEELETSKEELQSTNEELTTLNDEMQNRNQELNQLNNDVTNLLNGVEIAIVIVDAGLRVRRFTPQARSTMNLLPADVGRPISDIRPNVNVAHLDQLITQVMETITPKELEVQDREGRWYRLQIRPYKTVDNKIDGAFLSLVDVDTLKRAQEAAEWGREYAAGIVEAVQVPLLALDDKLVVQSANAAFYEVFGASRAETEGRGLLELGKGQWDDAELQTRLAEVLPGNKEFQNLRVERKFPRLGMRTMWLSARPVRSGAGMSPRILLAIEDITDREHAEQGRERLLHHAQAAEASAEQATLAKDRFLAVLSHELRTPLSALLLQVTLLRRRAAEGADIERTLDAIERAARIQARLTDDLLDVSRIISGKLDLAIERVDIIAVVREAIEMVRAMADGKSVALEATLDESVGPVLGDPIRLRQVVWNLLTNAIKATPEGGRITTGLDRVNGRVRIEVRDTGVGIEADFLPHVFDVFTQGQAAKSGGLGLGLAIVRHVVEQHKGTVEGSSLGPGQGATFTVTLPVVVDGALPRAIDALGPVRVSRTSGAAAQVLDLDGLRILVVEDDPETREPLVEMLRTTGAEVRAATSATQAMQIFEEFHPQLLLSDIGMPTEDGHSLIRRIRELGPARGGDVRALALTAMASARDRQEALAAGFNMHLAKPIGFDELTDALLTLLNRRRGSERRGRPDIP